MYINYDSYPFDVFKLLMQNHILHLGKNYKFQSINIEAKDYV